MKLIDKQKALDALMAERKYLIARSQEGAEHVLTHHAYNIIDEQPIIESRSKGRWIEVTNGRGGHECSECHAYAPSHQNGDELCSDFCPNCGADMRGDSNG